MLIDEDWTSLAWHHLGFTCPICGAYHSYFVNDHSEAAQKEYDILEAKVNPGKLDYWG